MRHRRLEAGLFATLFVAYAWFFQGGGWNQNGRFAQVRALVEQGRFAIDDYLVYRSRETPAGPVLERHPLPDGIPFHELPDVASSGDLARHPEAAGIYPIKPPGAVLLAAPAYAVAYGAERVLGASPDRWGPLTFNAYWTTWLSAGASGALLCVLVFAASRRLFPDLPATCHLAAATTLGLATLVLPFATALFDHVPTALGAFAAFYALLRAREAGDEDSGAGAASWLAAAGFFAGFSVVANYTAAPLVLILGVYAVSTFRPRRRVGWFVLGGAPWALFLGWYHDLAFGSPWTVANLHAHGHFTTEGELLGAFGLPDPLVLWNLLVSEHRGLLFTSPVLALAVPGLWWTLRRRRGPEALVVLTSFLALWLTNGAFNFWHGGWTVGPRFLIPALPFLALTLTPVFHRLPRLAGAAAIVSAAVLLFATAVDVQPPPDFERPWRDYLLPLAEGRELTVARAPVAGRVSANAIGFYEGWYYTAFPRGSRQAEWNSFNLGELLWPGSPWSVLPLALFLILALAWLRRLARRQAASSTTASGEPRRRKTVAHPRRKTSSRSASGSMSRRDGSR